MAQNTQRWLFDIERFPWAREHIPTKKWYQIIKYFPGYRLRRQMVYVDAATGEPITAQGGEEVPPGRVYIYGYDLRNFCGIDVPGLDEAMNARPPSRVQQRAAHGDQAARPNPAAPAPPAPQARPGSGE